MSAGNEVALARDLEQDFRAMATSVSKKYPDAAPIVLERTSTFGERTAVALFRLANGLKLIVLEDHSSPVFAYHTWFRVGSRYERKGKTGMAHLFEHLMFKGTKNYPPHVFDRLLEEAGAQTNAATWLDWTFYYENLPSGNLDLVARLESDRMANLVLIQKQLDSEREVVKSERRYRVESDPEGLIDETLMRMVFSTHPYGQPTVGYMKDLDKVTLEDCMAFYHTYYSPTNAVIVVVGDVETMHVLETVARYYGSLRKVEVPKNSPHPEKPQRKQRRRTLTLPVAREIVSMGFRTAKAGHADTYALDVLNDIMFGSEASRMYRLLVDELELASDVDAASESFALDGVFLVQVTLNQGKSSERVLDLVMQGFRELCETGPTEEELTRARNRKEAQFLKSMLTAQGRATLLGVFETVLGDYSKLFEYVPAIERVTSGDVRRVACKYFAENRLNVVIARPQKEGKADK